MGGAVDVVVIVIGAGQAGLSLSHCLSRAGIGHVVLESGAIGESWRSARWDSFCLVIPNWSVRLAGQPYRGPEPDGFMSRDALIDYLEAYADSFAAPVETGVRVVRVSGEARAFSVEVEGGPPRRARAVVVATGTHRFASVPELSRRVAPAIRQLPASEYRAESHLPSGAVLVVGSGQSGTQIAEELRAAGRRVYLATSRVGRLPRRYRGRDAIDWQRRIASLDRSADALDSPAHRFRPDPHLSGRDGGRTIDLRALAGQGITLLGRVTDAVGGSLRLADDLADNVRFADDYARGFAAEVDDYIARRSIVAPATDAHNSALGYLGSDPVPPGPRTLDLERAGISVIIWATGFRHDFSWVDLPVLDEFGYPRQRAGRSDVPGLHFLGLNYVDRRGSGILYGVGEDAERLAAIIARDLTAEEGTGP